jgi:ubiquinone/menaquinone biosynthesis C-methylase UbiE
MNQDEFEAMETDGPGKWWYDTREELLVRELNKLSSNKPNLKILDLASAIGGNFPLCSKYGEVFGLDISWSSIQICKGKHIKNLVQADAQVLPFADGSVDVVIALDVLEHLENDSSSMREIARVLNVGGIFIFNTPAVMQLFSYHDLAFHHFRRYSSGELRNKLIDANFKVNMITYWSFFIFPAVYSFRKIKGLFRSSKEQPSSDFQLNLPTFIDSIFQFFSRIELQLLKRKIYLPIGVSLFGTARKL